jgi:trigger factor
MSEQEKNETTEEVIDVQESPENEDELQFVEDPTFDLDYKGECLYEIKVRIPAANEKDQAEKMFEDLKGEAELPGFRKGRAPLSLLKNKFTKAVRNDVVDKLAGAAFRKLIKDEELKPLDFPELDGLDEAKERDDNEPISFSFKLEVAPRCELGKYRGIAVERPVLKVDEKDIKAALDEACNRFSTYEPVKNGKAKDGDQVTIDFKGTIDGEEFEGGAAENYPYIVGSKRFFAEFEEALVGAKAKTEVTCVVNFPDDYSAEALAGKAADFTIKVNELKRRKVPKLDDDLAKQAGFDDAAAMRAKIEEQLRDNSKTQSDSKAEANAMETIVADSTFELPASLVESSAKEYYEQEVRRLMELRMPASELEKRDEEIRKESREIAINNIKGFVAVNEIGEAEDIEVTEEDFENEATAIMNRTGMEMDVVNRFLAQSEQRDSYESRLFRQKAMAVVMDNAEVTEKVVTKEELDKDDETSES